MQAEGCVKCGAESASTQAKKYVTLGILAGVGVLALVAIGEWSIPRIDPPVAFIAKRPAAVRIPVIYECRMVYE